MWSPRIARFVSGCLAIAVHELLFILALGIEDEKVEIFSVKPEVYYAVVPSDRFIQEEPAPAWMGRWPIDCDHRALLCMPSDQIVADTKCSVCGWSWWVLRASLGND
jgi:hypothetical protein